MAQTIHYPPGLQAAVAELGVKLPPKAKFDAKDDLITLSEDFRNLRSDPDADFGGFSFKKLGRGIGKIGKGIGKGIKKIAKNPVVQVLNPALAITAHTTDKALGGKGVIRGKLGKIVDAGTGAVMSMVPAKQLATGITGGRALAFAIPSSKIPIKQAMAGADKLLGDPRVANRSAIIRNTKAMAALGDSAAKRGLAVLTAVGHVRLARRIPVGKKAIQTPLRIPPAALTVRRSPLQVRALAQKKIAETPKKTFWQRVVSWFKG